MFDRIKTRLSSEEGFTLIELLVVIIILGILVAIAVPAYLSLTSKANGAAASSNVRSAIPAAESFYETNNTYTGLACSNGGATPCDTSSAIVQQAPGVKVDDVAVSTDGAAYCLDYTSGSTTAYYIGGDQVTGTSGFGTDTGVDGTITSASGASAQKCSDVVSG